MTLDGRRSLLLLGTRGIPGRHGGFETFAEHLALYLAERKWEVTVYCQKDVQPGEDLTITQDHWRGIRRVMIPVSQSGALGTIIFDYRAVRHAMREVGVPLVLGYNTAILSALFRLQGRPLVTNMDGIEWKRQKWSRPAKLWLWLNDWIASLTSDVLIADHPEIAVHLKSRRREETIVTIPYGSDSVTAPSPAPLAAFGLAPNRYLISICRIEPENSILTLLQGFNRAKTDLKFVCLGKLDPDTNPYHAAIRTEAGSNVIFPGAIYDPVSLASLRGQALAYCHGHTVGGTNPSLVEALGAGAAVIAHDNKYNRWTAGSGQLYFKTSEDISSIIEKLSSDPSLLEKTRKEARRRHHQAFQWPDILSAYERVLGRFAGAADLAAKPERGD